MGRFERQDIDPDSAISKDLHLWDELLAIPTRAHSTTQLAAGDDNLRVWRRLPALRGANKLRSKPAAEVLLETPAEDPLLIAGTYGRGRTLAFAGNTTSRWWRYGYQDEHRRFWRQLILWLTHREDAARDSSPHGESRCSPAVKGARDGFGLARGHFAASGRSSRGGAGACADRASSGPTRRQSR